MTPQTAALMASAGLSLSEARRILEIDIPRQAARLAYYAQFHADQALVFERTGKVAKTHKGVRAQFHRLARMERRLAPGLSVDLTAAYHFKEAADYESGGLNTISSDDAIEALQAADHFVASIRNALVSDQLSKTSETDNS